MNNCLEIFNVLVIGSMHNLTITIRISVLNYKFVLQFSILPDMEVKENIAYIVL